MKVRNWDMWIGVWSGILILSVVNIVLIVANRNQPLYDWYILGVSIIVLIVITLMRSRSKI
jgi:hypothetical protein